MVELATLIALLVVGYWFGSHNEKRHFEDLKLREKRVHSISARTDRGPKIRDGEVFLVDGSVVIASDYFKTFIGTLKNEQPLNKASPK